MMEALICSLCQSILPVFRDPPMQLMSAMIQKMGDKEETPLPQENMDGCESDEWSD